MVNSGFTRTFDPVKVLSPEQLSAIKQGVLDTLEQTGVRFQNDKALELFQDSPCEVDLEEEIVKIPPGLAERALRQSPSSFRLRGRDQKDDLLIGGDKIYFEAGVGKKAVDVDTLELYDPTVEENNNGVRVVDAMENIHRFCSYCPYMDLEDVPPDLQFTKSADSRFRYSTKVSRTAHSNGSDQFSIKMAKALDMDIVCAMESTPPLNWSSDAIDAAFRACETTFPVRITSGNLWGATAPATISGALVSGISTIVSGIVLLNLIKPGKKVEANCFTFPMEMSHAQYDFTSISSELYSAAFTQFFRSHDLPVVSATGQFSLAKNVGFQKGSERAFSMLLAALSGANVIHLSGALHAEMSWSPELAVLDNDLAGAVGHIVEGINVDDEKMALDLINKVGSIPGTFSNKKHTAEMWQEEIHVPKVMDRTPLETWQEEGRKTELDKAKEKVNEIINEHETSLRLTEEQSNRLDEIYEEAIDYYKREGSL